MNFGVVFGFFPAIFAVNLGNFTVMIWASSNEFWGGFGHLSSDFWGDFGHFYSDVLGKFR